VEADRAVFVEAVPDRAVDGGDDFKERDLAGFSREREAASAWAGVVV